jgi:hypothetical protein
VDEPGLDLAEDHRDCKKGLYIGSGRKGKFTGVLGSEIVKEAVSVSMLIKRLDALHLGTSDSSSSSSTKA